MSRISRFLWVVLVLALAAPLATLAQDDATVQAAFLESEPNSLDPQAAQNADEFQVLYNVCEGLIGYEPTTLQPAPRLAESWEISDDGLVYTFYLRPGVKFHNGRELTADDVKYTFTRLGNPATGTSYTSLLLNSVVGFAEMRAEENPATELTGVEVIDPQTIQITLTAPAASFLNQLALPGGMIVAQEAAEAEGFSENPVCTGPYMVSEWQRQNQLTLQAFADYWGGAPQVQTAVLRTIPQQSQQVIEFEAGNLDVAWVPEPDLARLRDDATLSTQLQTIPLLSLFHLRVNLNDDLAGNPLVRQALLSAIDKQTIVDTVLQGQGAPANGIIPPGLSAHDADYIPYPYDLERARELLTEAGFPDGVEITVRTGQIETENRVMAAIQQQVAEAGITLNINSTESGVYAEDRAVCNMEFGTIAWGMDYPDPDNILFLVAPAASGSRFECGYNTDNPTSVQIAEQLAEASALPAGPARDDIFRAIEQEAMDEAMIIPIYHGTRTALVSPNLGGTVIDANSIIRFDLMTPGA